MCMQKNSYKNTTTQNFDQLRAVPCLSCSLTRLRMSELIELSSSSSSNEETHSLDDQLESSSIDEDTLDILASKSTCVYCLRALPDKMSEARSHIRIHVSLHHQEAVTKSQAKKQAL